MKSIPRRRVALGSLLLVVLLVGLAGGCGSSSRVPTTVQGLVQFHGHPLVGGLVVFAPDAERGGHGKSAVAEIQPDGSFLLQIEGSRQIPPGWYRVAIAEPPRYQSSGLSLAEFPQKLRRPDRSELLREVKSGKDNHFEFLIEPLVNR